MVDSPEQRRGGDRGQLRARLRRLVADRGVRAARTTCRAAWAAEYVRRSRDEVGGWLRGIGVKFFPVVNWAERGVDGDGNSVPRFHLTWGTGQGARRRGVGRHPAPPAPLRARPSACGRGSSRCCATTSAASTACALEDALRAARLGGRHRRRRRRRQPRHRAARVAARARRRRPSTSSWARTTTPTARCTRRSSASAATSPTSIEHVELRRRGPPPRAAPAAARPEAHPAALGAAAEADRRALLAAGDADVRQLLRARAHVPRDRAEVRLGRLQPEDRPARARRLRRPAQPEHPQPEPRRASCSGILLGKPTLVRHFVERCPDFVTRPDPARAGARGWREVTGDGALDAALLEREVRRYDDTLARGKSLWNDDQIRRIAQLRAVARRPPADVQVPGDRRPRRPGPLIAIRLQPMARKSLGGIQTDLECRVMGADGPDRRASTPSARPPASAAAACTASARSRAPSSAAASSPAASPRSDRAADTRRAAAIERRLLRPEPGQLDARRSGAARNDEGPPGGGPC